MLALSFLTMVRTHAPCMSVDHNYWTTREVPRGCELATLSPVVTACQTLSAATRPPVSRLRSLKLDSRTDTVMVVINVQSDLYFPSPKPIALYFLALPDESAC